MRSAATWNRSGRVDRGDIGPRSTLFAVGFRQPIPIIATLLPHAECFATSLEIGRPDVRIVSGAVSRDKVVEIVGLTLEEAEQRLASARKGTS